MTVAWEPIPGYPGYDASDQGQIRSYHKMTGWQGWSIVNAPQRTLRPTKDPNGYLGVNLKTASGEMEFCKVHRVILTSFTGPCPAGKEACHNNGNPADNRIANLRWDTRQANRRDMPPERRGKFSAAQVISIRERCAAGEVLQAIAADNKVKLSAICRIRRGESYADVSGPTNQDHARRILSSAEAASIRQRAGSCAQVALAREFHVSESLVSLIVRGLRY